MPTTFSLYGKSYFCVIFKRQARTGTLIGILCKRSFPKIWLYICLKVIRLNDLPIMLVNDTGQVANLLS